jgi:GAF domain-containing protein
MTESLPLTDELATVFARMSGLLLSQESVSSALALVVSLARDTVPGASGCGVSLMDEQGRRTTAAATDARVEQADALQYELNQGPCLAAWAQREVMRIDDTANEQRWERWCAAAHGLGLRSTLSAPMLAGGVALGAIKVYGEQPASFEGRAEDLLVRFASQAAVLLANAQAFESAQELSEGLKEALRTRDVIATAKGILMGRDGLDEETAFSMLVSASQRQNIKLREVADAIVTATSRRQR